jgi:hypothetical protein
LMINPATHHLNLAPSGSLLVGNAAAGQAHTTLERAAASLNPAVVA